MNWHFVIFDPTTGEIVQSGHEHPMCVQGRIAQGEHVLRTDGPIDPSASRVDFDTMQIVAKPAPVAPELTYADRRRTAYPPLADLADALYWRELGDETKWQEWLSACDAVKQTHPKGA